MAMFEDEYNDILRKARRGVGLTTAQLADRAALPAAEVESLESGHGKPEEAALRSVAAALGLSADKLAALALRPHLPRTLAVAPPFEAIRLDRAANCYVLADPVSGSAVIVDPGDEPARINSAVERLGLTPVMVLVTHGHSDHDGAAFGVITRWRVPVVRAEPGRVLEVGRMEGRIVAVPGHTDDSVAFIFDDHGIAFTGDALFARSLGGTRGGEDYRTLLSGVAAELLSLPPDTVLAPGHGPLTTAGDEALMNPFFP